MAIDEEWSDDELTATVEAYLEMLRLETSGKNYVKADYRRQLRETALRGRSDGSIEYRFQNISSVMEALNRPRIRGYKPARNVGSLIEARLRRIIAASVAVSLPNPTPGLRFADVVRSDDYVMGVKAVFGHLHSHVLCFGGRGDRNSKSYFSVAASVARRALTRPFIVTIGGGRDVRDGLEGKVLNVARAALVYGPTNLLISDPSEIDRLSQWPVALALHDIWTFVGDPHLVHDLGFPDRKILAGAQDGIVRPEGHLSQLWMAVRDWPIQPAALPLPGNFYDSGQPKLVMSQLPTVPMSAGAEEGKRIWKLQKAAERGRGLARAAKVLNRTRYGIHKCEACEFSHNDGAMFDAHHPTPLAVGSRTTLPEHLQILCPTCHRRAHRKEPLDPFMLHELQSWVAAGRP